jgi:general secretion pathway protein D
MKQPILKTLPALCVAALLVSARAQDNPPANEPNQDTNTAVAPDNQTPPPGDASPPPPDNMAPPAEDNAAAPADNGNATVDNGSATAPVTPAGSDFSKPAVAEDQPAGQVVHNSSTDSFVPPATAGAGAGELRMNFHNAPLDEVLNYLSDAAGFIIVLDTQVHGTVSVMSSSPMTRDEAVDLLNDELNKNGYAAIRNGRKLTIVDKNAAKTMNIPVKVTNDPDQIPDNAEVVTEIVPIRFVDADQLSKDLSLFVSPQATIVANDAGNSIVVTDTQSNIKHLVEIIRAVDDSAEGETQIRVFHLEHANPTDVANELAQIFPSNNGSSGTSQSPVRFGGGGPGGFFARMMANSGGSAASGSTARMQKQSQVLATPDLRTSSVIVTASKDLMQEIDGMMAQLDVVSSRDQKVFVYHLDNADPEQALTVLEGMFGGTSGSSSRGGTSSSSTTTSALGSRETQNASSSGTSTTSSGIGGSSGGAGGGAAGGNRSF